MLPILYWWFPATTGTAILISAAARYGLSKAIEYFYTAIYAASGGIVSGHTLKHLAAAAASWPPRIPDTGDVSVTLIAYRMGLSTEEFEHLRPQLELRGFPLPDETTGRYCIEAVDRWRRRRFPKLFPELTATPLAVDAAVVGQARIAALRGETA